MMQGKRSPWTGDREGFAFVGRLALDFAHSGGPGDARHWERIHSPADLEAWLRASSLAVEGVRARRADLGAIDELRAAIWQAAHAVAHGRSVPAAQRAVVNRLAARPPLVPRLTADGAQRWERPTVEQALASIARDAIDLLADPAQRARLRECAAPDCRVLFYDGSRPGRRRWCAPEGCGDRNRARAYRARQRAA